MRKIVALLVVLVIVVASWTGAWFYARDRLTAEMDRVIADLAQKGIVAVCPDRTAEGWPFRMEVSCTAPTLTLADGNRIDAAAIAAVWHVVDPRLVVVSALAPVTAQVLNGEATLGFEALRASVRTDDFTTGRISVETEKPVLNVTDAAGATDLTAETVELHLRPTPGAGDSWDFTTTSAGLTATSGDKAFLPAPANLLLDLTLSKVDALSAAGQPVAAWAAAGGELNILEAALEVGETRISAKGSGSISADGYPSGALDATATKIDWLTGAAREGKPVPPALAALGSAFLLIGRKGEGEGSPRTVAIAIKEGAVTVNRLPIAKIPPLFAAGS